LLVTLPMLPLREHVSLLNVALVYLPFIALVSAWWGFGPGLFASVTVNLLLDFFFVPPLYSVAPGKYEDALALGAFLAATAAVGALLARLRGREEDALLRQRESELLYELSTIVIADVGSSRSLETICKRLHSALGAELTEVIAADGEATRVLASVGGGRDEPGLRPELFPLRFGDETFGVLRVVGVRDLREPSTASRLVEAFARVAGLALYHERLLAQVAETLALEQADELKSALLAGVSHELRTPLASIKAAATTLLDATNRWDDAQRRELLTNIDGETDRLTRLVSDLLDLSRIEGGALSPRRDWYDVREFLETVLNRMAAVAGQHDVQLEVADDIGDAYFDYAQFGQVVSNLVENAAKFSPVGTRITVTASADARATVVTVADEGPGIGAEDLDRVFERFYRGRAASGVPGSGLGLAISRGIVLAHGGELTAESASGRGASFSARLPRPAARLSIVAPEAVA
jgi:two-component system sensor histidine kinase KdpD